VPFNPNTIHWQKWNVADVLKRNIRHSKGNA
jgi:hypothetical protein